MESVGLVLVLYLHVLVGYGCQVVIVSASGDYVPTEAMDRMGFSDISPNVK